MLFPLEGKKDNLLKTMNADVMPWAFSPLLICSRRGRDLTPYYATAARQGTIRLTSILNTSAIKRHALYYCSFVLC